MKVLLIGIVTFLIGMAIFFLLSIFIESSLSTVIAILSTSIVGQLVIKKTLKK